MFTQTKRTGQPDPDHTRDGHHAPGVWIRMVLDIVLIRVCVAGKEIGFEIEIVYGSTGIQYSAGIRIYKHSELIVWLWI